MSDWDDDDLDIEEGDEMTYEPDATPVSDEPLPVPDVAVSFTVPAKTIEREVLGHIGRQIGQAFESFVKTQVAQTVGQMVREIGREHIDAEIRAILAEGWQRTDDYGQARGGRVSLRDRVQEMFHKTDRYESRSMFEKVIKEELDKALKGELGKELDAARAKIRAEVDQITRAKLNEALKSALGLGAQ